MGYSEDISVFSKYMKEKYGRDVVIVEKSVKVLDRSDPRIMNWAHAIADYFKIDVNILFEKGRKNNSYEKIWMRYMIIKHEDISKTTLAKSLGLNHATVIISLNTCQGWADVYPDIYNGIIECAKRHNIINESGIKIVYQTESL